MEIDYANRRGDYSVHTRFLRGASAARLAFQHYTWVGYWGFMAALGVYVSLFAHLFFPAVIFVAMYASYFFRAVPYSRVVRAAANQTAPLGATKRIHLRIDDEGLHETVEGQVTEFRSMGSCSTLCRRR